MKIQCRIPKGFILIALFLITIGATGVALGLSLDEAKDRGLVGEKPNGYLGIVGSNQTPDIQTLVNDINRQRREKYREIAERNKTNLEAVELLAGRTAIGKTESGHFVQIPSGAWVKK